MKGFARNFRCPIMVTLVLMLVCGLGYPLLVTMISQTTMPYQANGSMIEIGGTAVGSELIGQDFTDPRFMKCRPSAVNYNTYTQEDVVNGNYAGISTGSKNYAPTNPALIERVQQDIDAFLAANPTVSRGEIPTDLLTASGSGLDPHISPASAAVQIPALAEATGLTEDALHQIVKANTQSRLFGIFGEEIVNVLKVNLEIASNLGLFL